MFVSLTIAKVDENVMNGIAESSNFLAKSCKMHFWVLAKYCKGTSTMPINKGLGTDRLTDINSLSHRNNIYVIRQKFVINLVEFKIKS